MKTLMAMGGALNRNKPTVLREFLRRAGGEEAHITILPQASALEDTGQFYEDLFRELGAGQATAIGFRQRSEADSPNASLSSKKRTAFSSPAATRCAFPA
jgi:cyanophycinase